MFSNNKNHKRSAKKHFKCDISLDKVVKRVYANATTVKNVQNKPDIILNVLDMMAINNQVYLNVSVSNFAA